MLTCHHLKKSLLFSFLVVSGGFIFTSCKDNQAEDAKQAATELNKPKPDVTNERDQRFLVQAAEFNLEEIMLGKLAILDEGLGNSPGGRPKAA